tara:strand:+ start:933 stop:1832 length:900 start_codon:yes stop_codon:yes gene_type:complete
MATRNVAMTVTFVAWDTSANTGKTGDASNIAVKWIKDGTVETLDTNTVTEVDATNCPGVYKVAISAAEANCNIGMLAGKSTTSDIVVLPISIQFERLPDAAPASNGGLPTVDANNHVNGVQDTLSVNVTQIEGSDATDQINAACDAAIETYGLDHLVSASVAGSDVADNSIVAKLVSKESTADWDDYVNTTDSLQAQRDYTGSGYTAIPWNSGWDAEVQSECADALTAHWGATLTEAYANDNAAATPAQLLYMIYSACSQFTVSGTDINCYGLDGSTVKMKFTLDDATSPTERKRASSP